MKIYSSLRVCKLEMQLDNTQSVPKKKEKFSPYSKKCLRVISPALLALGLVQDVY